MKRNRNTIIDDRWTKKEIAKISNEELVEYGINTNIQGIKASATLETNHDNFEKDVMSMFVKDFSNRVSSNSDSSFKKIKNKGGVVYG